MPDPDEGCRWQPVGARPNENRPLAARRARANENRPLRASSGERHKTTRNRWMPRQNRVSAEFLLNFTGCCNQSENLKFPFLKT
jgi:hypothetical protein